MKLSVIDAVANAFDEPFAVLKRCGFDATDYSLGKFFSRTGKYADIYKVTDAQIRREFTAIRKLAESVGFEIGQTHGAGGGHPRGFDFDYDEMVERCIASIKATHYLGTKHCVIHPVIMPGRRYDLLNKEAFDKSIEFYKRLTPALEKYDVYCCIENMWVRDPVYGHICSTILSHGQEMADMCDVLGDRFKICVDVGHCNLTQDDVAETVRACGDKLVCLHVHDTDGISDLHTIPFSVHSKPGGTKWEPMRTDWAEFMKSLDDVGYRGNLSFEATIPGPIELREDGLKYLAAIGRYLASLREIKY